MSNETGAPIPEGFKPVAMGGSFVRANGPFFVLDQGGTVKLGMRIEGRHCNAMGKCHGGMLTTFVDMMMPVTMYHQAGVALARRFLPTVSLQLDFLAPVNLGAWVEGEGQVLKVTRSLVFVQGLVQADGRAVLRCSGVYKIAGEIPADSPGMYTDVSPPAAPNRR